MLQVMFNNCQAKDTFFLDPTSKVQKIRVECVLLAFSLCIDDVYAKVFHRSAIPLEFWDCPGNLPLTGLPLHQFSTLLFVIDIQVPLMFACVPSLFIGYIGQFQLFYPAVGRDGRCCLS